MGEDRAAALVEEFAWDAHVAVHRVFDEHLEALHAAIGTPMTVLAQAVNLRHQLLRHIDFEERLVLPRCSSAQAAARDNVLRDHQLLRESGKRLEETALLAHFGRVDALRLEQRIVEFDRLLAHHDERETDELYGSLAAQLDPAQQTQLLTALAATELFGPLDETRLAAATEHPTLLGLCERYRRWIDGADHAFDAAIDVAGLPTRLARTLPKLLLRDARVAAGVAEADSARAAAHKRMLADTALRSSIAYLLDGLI
jgi:hemerythrin-like domain-containing protein